MELNSGMDAKENSRFISIISATAIFKFLIPPAYSKPIKIQ
jgi:hypothetical protein